MGRALVALLTCLACQQAWAETQHRALGIEAALTLREFARHLPMNLSPDGRLAAYVVVYQSSDPQTRTGDFTSSGAPFDMRASDVWVTDTQTGRTQNLTGGRAANWGTAWSPDGKSLAFYSDRSGTARVWLWEHQSGALREISTAAVRSHGLELQWAAGGSALLVGLQPEGVQGDDVDISAEKIPGQSNSAQARPSVRVFSSSATLHDGGTTRQQYDNGSVLKDLALLDVASGRVRRLATAVHPMKVLISPDEQLVAFTEFLQAQVPGSHIQLYDLRTVRLDGTDARTLMREQPLGRWGLDFSWSPDSRTLAIRSGGHEFSEVYLVALTGALRAATSTPHPLFKGTPAWDDNGRFLYLLGEDALWCISSVDGAAHEVVRLPRKTLKSVVMASANRDRVWLRDEGRSVVLVAADALTTGLYSVRLANGRVRTLIEERRHYVVDDPDTNVDNLLAAPSLNQIVYVAEDARKPADLWTIDAELLKPRQLSTLNPDINAVAMGEPRIVEWRGRDARPYRGILLLPSDYRSGRRYPLVTFVYPIDVHPYANKFGTGIGRGPYNLQLLATRGYAVLFSEASMQPEDREPMKAVADSVLPGIDHVIELGIADPERLGVFGASAGGYATLALIVQSTRFKAAVSHAGPGNLLSLYGDLQNSGYSHGLALTEATFRMPDHPWSEERERYIRNSPWFFLDKVQTPLLLLHGTVDAATIVTQANEIFLGLKVLGKDVEYARYDDEGHGFSVLVNAADAVQRYIDWFDCHLKESADARLPARCQVRPAGKAGPATPH